MKFCFRLVGFGTRFQPTLGVRTRHPDEKSLSDSEKLDCLFENEIAVDVGSACRGHDGCEAAIYDHHFQRANFPSGMLNYGSAALTVLANAEAIASQGRSLLARGVDTIWIVTHREPDFDACCASYLVACLLCEPAAAGVLAAAGKDRSAADIFADWRRGRWPASLRGSAEAERARLLYHLAVYAAWVDQCSPDMGPREAGLRFIFQAAQARECFEAVPSDARAFFDQVLEVLRAQGLNLLIDAFRPASGAFAAEIEYVRNQEKIYEEDMTLRARLISVPVAKAARPYAEWKEDYRVPLWSEGGLTPAFRALREGRAIPGFCVGEKVPLDGVEITGPRCRFFKDWVRQDVVRSPRGEGFRFSAIAYPGEEGKRPMYFFSLDPEYAVPRRLHLYDLWVTLQAEEGADRAGKGDGPGRVDVLARSRDGQRGLLDPWFDGNSYSATIVVSPNGGSGIVRAASGSAPEDDPVMRVAARWLNRSFYADSVVKGVQSSWAGGEGVLPAHLLRGDIEQGRWEPALPSGGDDSKHLLFASVELREGLSMDGPGFVHSARQIGESLWRFIAPLPTGLPPDFQERHLMRGEDWVLVWNRRGIAVASKRSMDELGLDVRAVAEILARIDRSLDSAPGESQEMVRLRLKESRSMLEQVTRLERKCRSDEGRAIRPFLEAVGLGNVAREVDALNNLYRDTLETRRDNVLTDVLAVGSFLAIAVSWIQTFADKPAGWGWNLGQASLLILIGMGIVYVIVRLGWTGWFPRRSKEKHEPRT